MKQHLLFRASLAGTGEITFIAFNLLPIFKNFCSLSNNGEKHKVVKIIVVPYYYSVIITNILADVLSELIFMDILSLLPLKTIFEVNLQLQIKLVIVVK